ncbi:MAG TPA: LLM class flavin-dependent oxidoreductase [Ktedonobacteraceae bacterium]|jgi:alkanesulfonate monooxygenase SsuD/methylene tetrahydromethanopterin reductase-like flavin-dependent oxidoreductase (luciferase family)|nr:LLM class flavin-dependent oxidoreductase [Ktedonobacteraceae bacterium]
MATLDFGIMLRQNDPGHSIDELLDFNTRCIELASSTPGFTTLWLEDHFQSSGADSLECLTTLSYLAAAYPRFKVGSMVLGQSYRNPALLAKMAANLQAITHGRLILGIGAGWKEEEYRSYNYPFPSVGTRMDELEEAVQILRALWTSNPATFVGKHYAIREAYSLPLPNPPIPLLIGGGGEKRTLGLVARYADSYNFNSCTVDAYAHKVAVLKQHCERIGRNPAEITLTYLSTISVSDDPGKVQRSTEKHLIAGNADEVIRELELFRAIGVSHCMFRIPDLENLKYFVERIVPHFAA